MQNLTCAENDPAIETTFFIRRKFVRRKSIIKPLSFNTDVKVFLMYAVTATSLNKRETDYIPNEAHGPRQAYRADQCSSVPSQTPNATWKLTTDIITAPRNTTYCDALTETPLNRHFTPIRPSGRTLTKKINGLKTGSQRNESKSHLL